jgi:photosystem II stability/assembly factor-like uncharacterized protein
MRRTPVLALASAGLALALPLANAADLDPSLLAGVRARSIGPATSSGRVTVVTSSAGRSREVWVGAASGGVWKSTDGGLTFAPVFDDQPVASIGTIALDPANPDVVWVGTGEDNPRNSVSVGDGVYKSLDGGKTWAHLGLEKTEHVSHIVIDPRNPRVAWVGAMGQVWGENADRGVYKTEDGGKSWRKVLYVDERTGVADLVADPSNPDKLFAAMWDFRRWPWSFRSGGPGSGIYTSLDGGESWKRLTEDDGLPKGDLGRIGLAIAPSDPRIVYALVEADKSALIRSEDGGRTWKTVNSEGDVSPRPFYYADVRVDPQDPNRIYRLATVVTVSDDGGRTFRSLVPFRDVHPDHHAMWIDPRDPYHLFEGNDGGVYESRNRGETWRFVANLPITQFYHVRVDDAVPFNVYGGLQDNGSWKGPSSVWENGGVRNYHWQEVDFGDGFDTAPDPRDPMRGYAMSQEGFLVRWDLRTGERKDIRPAPASAGDPDLRFNWNAGFAQDPFDPDTIYLGSQYVHRSTDRGDSWTAISPDLTTNNPDWQKQDKSGGLTPDASGAENFTTILSIDPSPKERGVIWVGTDDGRLHVTRDGGKSWTSVEKNVHGVPANTWIPDIAPSPQDGGTAFVVFDNHRRSDWTPYVYKTTDYGRTWTSLATKDVRGYALSVLQDPKNPDLVFLGTEFGLWASVDGGTSWARWKSGLPTVAVADMVIHPRDGSLVLATHGRGMYVLDDLSPLRAVSAATQKEPLHLFPIADAYEYRVAQSGSSRFPGESEFRADPRPYGALVTYSLNLPGLPLQDEQKERERKEAERAAARAKKETPATAATAATSAKAESPQAESGGETGEEETGGRGERGGAPKGPEAKIEILDGSGKIIRTFRQPAVEGVNVAVWNLRRDPFRQIQHADSNPFRDRGGIEVLPGTYTVRVSYKDRKAEGTVRVLPDPRYDRLTPEARAANYKTLERVGAAQEALAEAVDRIRKTRADVDTITAKARALDEEAKRKAAASGAGAADDDKGGPHKELLDAARQLGKKLDEVEQRLHVPEGTKGLAPETDVEQRLGSVSQSVSSSWDAPTPAQLAYLERAEAQAKQAFADLDRILAGDVAQFRAKAHDAGLDLLAPLEPIRIGQ